MNTKCNATYPNIAAIVCNCPDCGAKVTVTVVDGILQQEQSHECQPKTDE